MRKTGTSVIADMPKQTYKYKQVYFVPGKLAQVIRLPVNASHIESIRNVIWTHFANSVLTVWYDGSFTTEKVYTIRMLGAGEKCQPLKVLHALAHVIIVIEDGDTTPKEKVPNADQGK